MRRTGELTNTTATFAGPIISVVIPVYNDADYLHRTLSSLEAQNNCMDIEVICVNDASTDSSASILAEIAARSKQMEIRIIELSQRSSAHIARRTGVLNSRGKYVMFLDADDYLEPDACATLMAVMDDNDSDMTQFATRIVGSENLAEDRIRRNTDSLRPKHEYLTGHEIVQECFQERAVSWTVWSKIYKGDFARDVFARMVPAVMPKGQDVYETFMLCWNASTYSSIDVELYNYHMSAGATAGIMSAPRRLDLLCSESRVVNALEDFTVSIKETEDYGLAAGLVSVLRNHFLNECLSYWNQEISDSDAASGFSVLVESWPILDVIAWIRSHLHFDRGRIARRLDGAQCLHSLKAETNSSEPKVIGLFYHTMTIGGVQRVISYLIPMYISMGYRVVLFTDRAVAESEEEFEIPDEVRRVLLPSSGIGQQDNTSSRLQALRYVIEEEGIDLMCYHAAHFDGFLYDLLAVKTLGIPIILTVHETFSHGKTYNSVVRPFLYKLCDLVQGLSPAETAYWAAFGVRSAYVQNPVIDILDNCEEPSVASEQSERDILWMGRFEESQKQCSHLIYAMAEVVKTVPDARLLLVGSGSNALVETLKGLVRKLALEENVVFCGSTLHIEQYLQNASVYMLTSTWETFPMVVAETKACGLPLVLYALPNLAMLEDPRGYIAVSQGDYRELGRQAAALLLDSDRRKEMGMQARESAEPFLSFDLQTAWKDLFTTAMTGADVAKPVAVTSQLLSRIVQRLRDGSELMVSWANDQNRKLSRRLDASIQVKKLKEVESSLEFYRWSSYVLQERITYLENVIKHQRTRVDEQTLSKEVDEVPGTLSVRDELQMISYRLGIIQSGPEPK